MLIVGFGLMLAAFTVFIVWNVYMRCRLLWHARQARTRQRTGKQDAHKQDAHKQEPGNQSSGEQDSSGS